jgi:hypothetical protein
MAIHGLINNGVVIIKEAFYSSSVIAASETTMKLLYSRSGMGWLVAGKESNE